MVHGSKFRRPDSSMREKVARSDVLRKTISLCPSLIAKSVLERIERAFDEMPGEGPRRQRRDRVDKEPCPHHIRRRQRTARSQEHGRREHMEQVKRVTDLP